LSLPPRWLTATGDGNQPPPLVVNDLVFSPGGDSGGFTALDARSGRRLWTYSTDGAPTISPAIAAKNVLYAGDHAGILRAFQTAPPDTPRLRPLEPR
jgi:outer membrane protein assembly factor BamB